MCVWNVRFYFMMCKKQSKRHFSEDRQSIANHHHLNIVTIKTSPSSLKVILVHLLDKGVDELFPVAPVATAELHEAVVLRLVPENWKKDKKRREAKKKQGR